MFSVESMFVFLHSLLFSRLYESGLNVPATNQGYILTECYGNELTLSISFHLANTLVAVLLVPSSASTHLQS